MGTAAEFVGREERWAGSHHAGHLIRGTQAHGSRVMMLFFLFASVPLTRLKHSYMYNTPESAHQLCRVPFQAVDLMCLIGCAVLQFQFMLVMRPHPPPPSSDSFIDSLMMLPIRHVASNIITNCNC